jgi:Mg-chelatase subunit ChlD
MPKLMRCPFCGHLQDEPTGVKECGRCGGGLEYENKPPAGQASYLQVQMELDQVAAPARQNVERYILVTLRTPKEVPAEEMPITKKRPPISFTAVLDVSGSMQGEKITQAREAVRQAAHYLRSGDVFSLVAFNNDVTCLFKPTLVDEKTRQAVDECLQQVHAGGMTALDGGLVMGIEQVLVRPQDTNLVMLLSDGQTNVGEKDLEVIGGRALQAREKGVLVSALGIGLDYNEVLLTEIASQGGGRFYHLENAAQIPAYVAGELKEVAALAARDVQIRLQLPTGATLVPLSATFPVRQEGEQAVVLVGDMPCETELMIPLRLALLGQAPGARLSVEGAVTFRSPAGHEHEVTLNRVTVRFMEQGKFTLQEGVAAPVVERVLVQMRASNVLGLTRMWERRPQDAEQQTKASVDALRAYASLLGEERGEREAMQVSERFSSMRSDRKFSKDIQSAAYFSVRGGKKHD